MTLIDPWMLFQPEKINYANQVMSLRFDDLSITPPSDYWVPGSSSNFQAFVYGTDTKGSGLVIDNIGNVSNAAFDSFFGASAKLYSQCISTDYPSSGATIINNVEPTLITRSGFYGETVKALRLLVKQSVDAPTSAAPPQCTFTMVRTPSVEIPEFYYSFYCELDPNLANVLPNPPTGGRWIILTEFKDYDNSTYRLNCQVQKDSAGELVFVAKGDHASTENFWGPYITDPATLPVQLGVPMRVEVYIKRPSSGEDLVTGITWIAITFAGGERKVICNQHGGQQMVTGRPLNQIMFMNAYSGGYAPYKQEMWGLEVWDGFPHDPSLLAL